MSKILIIEDEIAIADLERDYLEINDFEVSIENDGEKGLEVKDNTEEIVCNIKDERIKYIKREKH